MLPWQGKKKLIDGGYQYVFDKLSTDGERKFWRCDQKMNGCPVRVHTDSNGDIIKRLHDHNHGSSVARVEVNRLRTAVKRRAEDTVEVRTCRFYGVMLNYAPEAGDGYTPRRATASAKLCS